MANAEKIAISLPRATVRRIERLRRRSGQSRSALIRQAVERLFRDQEEATRILRYQEGYRKTPETPQEIAAAESAAAELLSQEPWE